jgi:tetratricopeptide (TPR) repeat protein
MDNRKYHRAIFFRAGLYMEDDEKDTGIELYRQLLKMWPNDNMGVRYYIAAVYQGKSVDDVDKMWNWANENQKWDELEKMVETENKKHHFWKVPKDE